MVDMGSHTGLYIRLEVDAVKVRHVPSNLPSRRCLDLYDLSF